MMCWMGGELEDLGKLGGAALELWYHRIRESRRRDRDGYYPA